MKLICLSQRIVAHVLIHFKDVAKLAVSFLFRPAGRERAGGVSGAKNENGYIPINA